MGIPPLKLEDLGIPTPEVNREFIIRLNEGIEYLTGRIADLQIEINELKKKVPATTAGAPL